MAEWERVGVDVGGTFTDFVFLAKDGEWRVSKRPSTPTDPAQSALAGIAQAKAVGEVAANLLVVHGTTVATNALLERRGAKTALLTTQGFRDTLEIGRQARANLYALHPRRPIPLLGSESRHEIAERMGWQGQELVPLDTAQAETLLAALEAEGVESLAVCFLFSYLNPAHEQAVGALARKRGFPVSLSCEIAPEPREFERASATVANAFVAPIMTRYLTRLEAQLRDLGVSDLRVMQSNGGALSAQEAGECAVKTVLSGPAGGVVAATQIGTQAGFSRLLTFDMGGTSTDVALIIEGQCPVVTLAETAGIPLRTPMLDIHTVGAGGGSLARLDAVGGLRVGPQSAGADPGPVAYGKGETLTVTDANLLLGRLPADLRLGGSVALDSDRVAAHFARLAADLRCAPEEAALGILRVANASMTRALRHISIERGYDPAEFTLLSFGGAGGLHAPALAESLGMTRLLIPRFPGAFSALGLALAETRREYVQLLSAAKARNADLTSLAETLESHFSALEARAASDWKRERAGRERWHGQRLLDMRYAGQSFDLRIPLVSGDLTATFAAFHTAHKARYGHADAREPVEVVGVRLVTVSSESRRLPTCVLPKAHALPLAERRVYFAEGWRQTPLYDRAALGQDQRIVGPAIFVQDDATTLLEPGWQAVTDKYSNLICTILTP